MSLLTNFIALFVESAPWLLLGFLVAAIMRALVPTSFLTRHLGEPGFTSTVKAALIGAPLPLCSCGVIPAAVSLREAGASKSATTSFLISTPETGVDSISITYALLGPVMAITRPIAAITSAITAGLLVKEEANKQTIALQVSNSESKPQATIESFTQRMRSGLKYVFVDLVRDIAKWLLIGLVLAAAIKTFIPTELLQAWGRGWLAFVLMAAIGVPMYICATASTPIAAGLLFAGVSPGAVLVFLLVGPATNIATVGLVSQQLGKQALYAYLASVIGVAFLFGYLLNLGVSYWQIDYAQHAEHAHQFLPTNLSVVAAALLAGLMAYAFFKDRFATPAEQSCCSHD